MIGIAMYFTDRRQVAWQGIQSSSRTRLTAFRSESSGVFKPFPSISSRTLGPTVFSTP